MGVGRCQALSKLDLDEAELIHLIARVQAVAPGAALWDREPVAFLPGPQGGGRDVEHPRHRADAVDGSAGHSRTLAGPSSWHKPEPISVRIDLFNMYTSAPEPLKAPHARRRLPHYLLIFSSEDSAVWPQGSARWRDELRGQRPGRGDALAAARVAQH